VRNRPTQQLAILEDSPLTQVCLALCSYVEARDVDLELEARLASDLAVDHAQPDELRTAATLREVNGADMIGTRGVVHILELLAHELVGGPVNTLTVDGAVMDASTCLAEVRGGTGTQGTQMLSWCRVCTRRHEYIGRVS